MSRVSDKPSFVYVLWSPGGRRFYIGISENPANRLKQHNESPLGWSARYRPWILVHQECYPDYRSARQRENYLKRQKGGMGFYQATGIDPARLKPQ
jgi:putative endonuclease